MQGNFPKIFIFVNFFPFFRIYQIKAVNLHQISTGKRSRYPSGKEY